VIESKILNSLELDYPKEMLEVVVVSDASEDGTDRIVQRYADSGVKLRRFEGHIGKTACLNKSVPLAIGEVIVFSDANSQYDKFAIRHLVKWFEDKAVGFVTGRTEYISCQGTDSFSSTGLYTQIERYVKVLESKISSCVGADGAIFAIRKNLYPTLQDYDINDLVIPLKIVGQGHRGVFEEAAYCIEESAGSSQVEFRRHIRITARSLRAIFNHVGLLNPFKYPLFSFQLLSHKLIRFLTPFAIVFALLLNAIIVFARGGETYIATFALQVLFYVLWGLGYFKIKLPLATRAASFANTFFVVNLAILIGWVQYLRGETYTTWSTSRQNKTGDTLQQLEAEPMPKKKELARP
jgi:cellulose synthase/poly-beta-1,6-N-acetylglucosamine synthase-like glycosyltransferase